MTKLERGPQDGSCIGSTRLQGDGLSNRNAALSLTFSSPPSGVPPHLASIQKSRDENAPSQEMAPVAPRGKIPLPSTGKGRDPKEVKQS